MARNDAQPEVELTIETPRGSVLVIHAPGVDLPPPRPGVRYVRIPRLGVVHADDRLRRHVDRQFHWPMIMLALLILPFLAIDYLIHPPPGSLLWWVTVVGLGVIWLAFLVEFICKVAIAESRFEYCKRNWLDIVIIILPMLRPLRVGYLARSSRVFTLRGVGMKCLRYGATIVIGLEASERLLHRFGLKTQAGRRDPREMTREQLMDEVKRLRKLIDAWEDWHQAHEAHQARLEAERDPRAERFERPPPQDDRLANPAP